jgi:hypothetical protein
MFEFLISWVESVLLIVPLPLPLDPLFVIFRLSSLEEATGGGEESKTEKNISRTYIEMNRIK